MKKLIFITILAGLNVSKITAKDCFSLKLGYPCCSTTTTVVTSDSDGDWGIENNSWCGIEKKMKISFPFFGGFNWNNKAINAASPNMNVNNLNINNNNNAFNGWAFNPWNWWKGNSNANANSNVNPNTNFNSNFNINNNINTNTNLNTNNNANVNSNVNTNTKNPNTNNNNNINGNVNINNKINNNGNTNINKNNNANSNTNTNNVNINNNWNTNTNNNVNINKNNNTQKPNSNTNNNNNNNNNSNSVGSLPDVIGGKSGVTTAYWDCCVASCSWDANVSGSKPVKACRKDGVSLVTEELWKVKSVCDNGDAYMCNDQQPIVINEKLSYGFAASHDPCCSCQRLQFTSGPIKGKQMIVQITNTGSDVGTNHFDIQIPGGGVGIFNGCSKQWGAPNDGWGRRYGGVTTKSECSQLPSQLRAGCEWRFGWFGSSDNPNVVYERVQCPKELTRISGCVLPDDAKQKKVV